MNGFRVSNNEDIWNDDKTELLVLANTNGIVIGYENTTPFVFIVKFNDGNNTFCRPEELTQLDHQHYLELPK